MHDSNQSASANPTPAAPDNRINIIGWAIFFVAVALQIWWPKKHGTPIDPQQVNDERSELIACPICDGTGDVAHRFRGSADRYLSAPGCPACKGRKQLTRAAYARYLQGPSAEQLSEAAYEGLSPEEKAASRRQDRPLGTTARAWDKAIEGRVP